MRSNVAQIFMLCKLLDGPKRGITFRNPFLHWVSRVPDRIRDKGGALLQSGWEEYTGVALFCCAMICQWKPLSV